MSTTYNHCFLVIYKLTPNQILLKSWLGSQLSRSLRIVVFLLAVDGMKFWFGDKQFKIQKKWANNPIVQITLDFLKHIQTGYLYKGRTDIFIYKKRLGILTLTGKFLSREVIIKSRTLLEMVTNGYESCFFIVNANWSLDVVARVLITSWTLTKVVISL